MNTLAEENYLKSIYHLAMNATNVSTNQLAALLNTKASSVTDMLKKLADKQLINYARYQGVTLTAAGEKIAVNIIRKHRLWEYFLVEKLNFRSKKLADKQLINYARYQGVTLTAAGEKIAVNIIRKHRLWEYFLVEKLNF